MRKVLLLLLLVGLFFVPTNAQAAHSVLTYGPSGTITTPYPIITAMVHAYNSFILLNETTMYLGTLKLNYTASLSNIIPGDSSWTSDILFSYPVQSALAPANYTVRLDVKVFDMATHTKVTLSKQWWFIVALDSTALLIQDLRANVTSINSTMKSMAMNYSKIWDKFDEWLPTLQTMNNTMHYWNSTIQNTWNVITNIQQMFSTGGTIYGLISDSKDLISYMFWGIVGIGGLILIFGIAIAVLVIRRTGPPSAAYGAIPPQQYPPGRPRPMVTSRQAPTGGIGQNICPNCKKSNRLEAKHCADCGEALSGGMPQ